VRLTANPHEVGRGLGQIVVVLLELLRDLLERQAVRRVDSGSLASEQVEELGQALIEVRDAIAQVRDSLGVSAEQARAATARARELVGEWPPSDLADGIAPEERIGRGEQPRRSSGAADRRAGRRTGGTPAVGRLLGSGRPLQEQGRPATRVRDATPSGWGGP
jgi:hypothetical protein